MNSGDHNPYVPPIVPMEEVRWATLAFPLGKLTIPWIIVLNIGIGWAVGSLFTYILSFYFSGSDLHPFIKPLMSFPFVQDTDDLAGILCYSSSFVVFAIFTAHLASRRWHTRLLPFPPFGPCVMVLIRSTLLLAPVWVVAGWFFEVYRHDLLGDGNWPAIACLTGIASFHWFLLQKLLASMQALEAEQSGGGDCAPLRASL
jgi:hypothetical protein